MRQGVPMQFLLQALVQARFHNQHLPLRGMVEEVLQRAVEARDIGNLRDLVAEGRHVGLDGGPMEQAQLMLMEEDRRRAIVVLAKAVEKRDRVTLRNAIAQGRAAGLDGADLLVAEAVLKVERLKKARDALGKAVVHRNAAMLYRAIVEGKVAGLPQEELEEAQRMVKDKQGSRMTTPGELPGQLKGKALIGRTDCGPRPQSGAAARPQGKAQLGRQATAAGDRPGSRHGSPAPKCRPPRTLSPAQ